MSRLTPYQPMRRPDKGVTQEDMWKTLAKHAKPDIQISPEAQSPKEKAPLEWKDPVWTSQHGQNGAGYRETVCGRFTISKDAHELGFSYTAWRREASIPPTILGLGASAKEAMKLCEEAR
jgi:hypothetical protein